MPSEQARKVVLFGIHSASSSSSGLGDKVTFSGWMHDQDHTCSRQLVHRGKEKQRDQHAVIKSGKKVNV